MRATPACGKVMPQPILSRSFPSAEPTLRLKTHSSPSPGRLCREPLKHPLKGFIVITRRADRRNSNAAMKREWISSPRKESNSEPDHDSGCYLAHPRAVICGTLSYMR